MINDKVKSSAERNLQFRFVPGGKTFAAQPGLVNIVAIVIFLIYYLKNQ